MRDREVQRQHPAQAVPEQHARQVRGLARQSAQGGEHGGHDLFAQSRPRGHVTARARRLAVPRQVERHHAEARLHQVGGERGVARAVLAQPVDHGDQGTRPLGAPDPSGQHQPALEAHLDEFRGDAAGAGIHGCGVPARRSSRIWFMSPAS
jgi:hypothetical protein